MKPLGFAYSRHVFTRDFLASIVVFLVALPLCLGIAIASGVPPALGLITAIIGGFIVGWIAGCPLQVSGPAAGLVAIVWEIVQQYGVRGLGVVVLMAGLMQIGAGVLRLGHWFRAVSPAVIHGMLAGIGVLIFASQFHVMVDDTPKSSGIQNLLSIPQAIYKGLFPMDGATHHLAAAVGILTIALVLVWNVTPKKLRLIPGSLVAVAVSVILCAVFELPINYVEIPKNLFSSVTLPSFSFMAEMMGTSGIWITAVTVAFVASAETMLTATAISQMNCSIKTDYNREMVAQGIGNTLCGMVGALPMTGVIVRSATNVEAGAQTRLSTILHGTWILALVALYPQILNKIPTAALAAILVYTGYRLVSVATMKKLWSVGKSELAIYFATLIGIVLTNLLEGVIIGIGLSMLKLLYNYSHLTISYLRDPHEPKASVFLDGTVNFINLPRLAKTLESIPPGLEVHIHLDKLNYIDHACLDLIMNWEKQYAANDGALVIEWEELMARFHQRCETDQEKVEQYAAGQCCK